MLTMKHNHNHKNYPHIFDIHSGHGHYHSHLVKRRVLKKNCFPGGAAAGAQEQGGVQVWHVVAALRVWKRSSWWCGSAVGASHAWVRKVKTCYFKPMSGSNNNALMFTICSLFAVKINHWFVFAGSMELMVMKMITPMVMRWRRLMSWTHSVWLEWGLDWIRTAVLGDLFVPGCTLHHLGSIVGAANIKSEFFWPTTSIKKHPVANISPLLAVTLGR